MHPLLNQGALTTRCQLHFNDGTVAVAHARVQREALDEPEGHNADSSLVVRVPVPALGAQAVEQVTIAGRLYDVLTFGTSRPALGSRVDWQSTIYTLRAA